MDDGEKLYQPVRELQVVVVQRPEQTLQYGNHDSYYYLYIKMIKVPFELCEISWNARELRTGYFLQLDDSRISHCHCSCP